MGLDGAVEHHGVDLWLQGGVFPGDLGEQGALGHQQCAEVGGNVPDGGEGVLDVRDSECTASHHPCDPRLV